MTRGALPHLYAIAACACLVGCTDPSPQARQTAPPAAERTKMPFAQAAAMAREEAQRIAKEGSSKCEDGPMTVGQDKITEKELALPFYPGSQSTNDHKFDQKGKTTFVSVRSTQDSPMRVIDFYETRLKVEGNAVDKGLDGQIGIKGTLSNGSKVSIQAGPASSGGTTVSIVVVQI